MILRELMSNGFVFATGLYFGTAIPFMIAERWNSMPGPSYRRVLSRDFASYAGVRVNEALSGILYGLVFAALMSMPHAKVHLPLWALIPTGILLGDFTLYWVHRGMHTRFTWPTHRWHHSSQHMYWFAGCRASLLHVFFYSTPGLWLTVFDVSGYRFRHLFIFAIIGPLTNHWMHTSWNVRVPRWVEKVFITPRAHRVHHSNTPAHYGRNFGALFSIWDHLFGTYLEPDVVGDEVSFGIPEKVNTARLVIGV